MSAFNHVHPDGLAYMGVNAPTPPNTKVFERAPLSSDYQGFSKGDLWVYENGSSSQIYILGDVVANSATWVLVGASSGGPIEAINSNAAVAGDYTLAGTTNEIDVAETAGTSTFSLSATLVAPGTVTATTSVTSPIYTTSAADMAINAASGQDVNITMGDDAGANKVSFLDDGAAEVGSLDSDGNLSVAGNMVMSSVATQLQMNGGAATDFIGQATLVLGTVTVANTNIAANDRIFLTRADANSSSALGELTITAQTASTSFVITALDPADGSTVITGDTSIVNYFIVRQN